MKSGRSSSAGSSYRIPRQRTVLKIVSLSVGIIVTIVLLYRGNVSTTLNASHPLSSHGPNDRNTLWREKVPPIDKQLVAERPLVFRADHRELARRALQKALTLRNKCSFRVIVFGWRRRASLRRLIDSLISARYFGFRVNIEFHFDGEANEKVVDYVRQIDWPHGSFRVNLHDKRIGLERVLLIYEACFTFRRLWRVGMLNLIKSLPFSLRTI